MYPSQPCNPTHVEPRPNAELLGPLELVTPPSGDALDLDQLKLRHDIDSNERDEDLRAMLASAAELCEQLIPGHRQFFTATYDVPIASWWRWGHPLRLPRPPLQSVSSIKYYDSAGVQQTLDPAIYHVRTPWRQPGQIELLPNCYFPPLQYNRLWPVTVRFVCGYGGMNDLPYKTRQALMMLVGHWNENREATGKMTDEVAFSVSALMAREGYGSYG